VLGERLAEGRMAEVYAWGDGRALKLFRPDRDMHEAEHETPPERLVHDAGIPSPAVYEVIILDGRAGIVFERVDGGDMAEGIGPDNLVQRAHLLAELHATTHARPPSGGSTSDGSRRGS
jgi:hypothetical protein